MAKNETTAQKAARREDTAWDKGYTIGFNAAIYLVAGMQFESRVDAIATHGVQVLHLLKK